METEGYDHANDATFGEKLSRRTDRHVRRTRISQRNGNRPKSRNAAPGGIRQRRNKRWAWWPFGKSPNETPCEHCLYEKGSPFGEPFLLKTQ